MQRHDSRRSEVIFHAEACWLSRRKVLERFFSTVARVACFPCSTKIPNMHYISRQFLALFESEFCVTDRAAIYEEFDLGFSHVAGTTQKMTGHDTRNTANNESQSSRS